MRLREAREWGIGTDRLIAVLLSTATLALLLATLDDYGMAWDEGFTVEREERLREWFARVAGHDAPSYRAWSPRLSKLIPRSEYLRRAGAEAESPWSAESLRFYWPFAREEPDGHPPFYALLGLAGWAVSHRFLGPPDSYRFGPVLLFAVTVGVVYRVMARSEGRAAGLLAALGLLVLPRLFAHAHLASYDVPLLCLWFLAVAAFLRVVQPPPVPAPGRFWLGTALFGLFWGCALGTKLTGWFLPVPLAAWVALYRDRRGACALAVGGIIALVVLYAMIPTWWTAPIPGLRVFFESNLGRQKLRPIPTVYLGRLYLFSLPWHNTLLITAITVPPAMLILALAGMGKVLAGRLKDRTGTLMLLCWGFFMVLRALPNTPGHDGERQFLTAFVFLSCLAGIGLTAIRTGLSRLGSPTLVTVLLLGATLGSGAWSTWRTHPLQLSYYNAFIGGLSGAARAGMEPTYYWEAVTPDVREWLNAHTPENRSVGFVFPAVTFEYLHHWGLLRPSPLTPSGDEPDWFVVMNRPGHLRFPSETSVGQILLDRYRPVLVKALPEAPEVPLVAIFSRKDAAEAYRLSRRAAVKPAPARSQPPSDRNPAPRQTPAPTENSDRPGLTS